MPSNFLDKLQEALNPSDSAIKGSGLIVGMSAVLIAATAVTNPIAASMLLCAGMSVSLQVITDCIEGNKTSISSLVTSAAVGAASGAVAGVTAAATKIAITELGYNAASHFAVATVSGASGATYDVTTQLLTTGKVDAKEVVLSTALAFGTGYALSKGSEVVSNKLNSTAVVAEKTENTRLFLQDETGGIRLTSDAKFNNTNQNNSINNVLSDKNHCLNFKDEESLLNHYNKHSSQIKNNLGMQNYSVDNYLYDANHIINKGNYVEELNGYIKFMKNDKYGFVGLDSDKKIITTFHIKTVSELSKKAPSSGLVWR